MAGDEVVAAENLGPVIVGGPVVDVDRAMLAAMGDQVGLAVAVDVQPPHAPPARDGDLKIAVWTVRPRHGTSRGSPTLTESSLITSRT